MRKKLLKLKLTLTFLFPVLLFIVGKLTGAIPSSEYSFSLFTSERNGLYADAPNFLLEEKIGIFKGVKKNVDPNLFPRFQARMPGFVVLCDLDSDTYEDVITIYNKPDKFGFLEIFKNVRGDYFEPMTESLGLKKVQSKESFSIVACADLNNDGLFDLILGGIGQPIQIFLNEKMKFSKSFKVDSFSEAREINVFDANQDGFLDILIGNFRAIPKGDYRFAKRLISSGVGMNSINEEGGKDTIFINNGSGKSFSALPLNQFDEMGYTWATGVSDFNRDGNLDLFIAHDLGRDSFFAGDGAGGFSNNSEISLGPLKSRGSMSAAVIDLNDDGLQDIFVSNTNQPGFAYGFNSMWLNQKTRPGTFKDEAIQLGLDACGIAWGAQFGDFNHDGWLDLAVVNGSRGSSTGVKEKGWYWWIYGQGAPSVDFDYFPEIDFSFFPKSEQKKKKIIVPVGASQRKCLFLGSSRGVLLDAAPLVGFNDKRIARGLVLFDFDKNGTEDILMGDPYSGPVLYKNNLKVTGRWIAVSLKGTSSNLSGIGSKLEVKTNERTIYRDYFPFNGFQSGSSREIFFTFKKSEYPVSISILWPNGSKSINERISLNQRYLEEEPRI